MFWIIITENSSSITDWISAISALIGIPLVLISIFKLVQRDKEKGKRLHLLEDISQSQVGIIEQLHGQIDELANQTSEFQRQTSLMADANVIYEKQFQFQISSYIKTQDLEEQKIEIEKRKRISEIKPYFVYRGGTSDPSGFEIKLLNDGSKASKIELIIPENSEAFFYNSEAEYINKNDIFKFTGKPKTLQKTNQITFDIQLKYMDEDQNVYCQKINRSRNGSITASPPILQQT